MAVTAKVASVIVIVIVTDEEAEVRWVGGKVRGEVSHLGAKGALGSSGLSD